jgi:hypothetical protein
MSIFANLTKPFFTVANVPPEHRANFRYLYWDIAWFGILSGTSLSFISVYAARVGATALEIGLLNAGPALVGLLFTLPAGRWLYNRPVGGAVFWSAAIARSGYLFWAILPLLLAPHGQIWALVGLVLLMTIPATILSVGFNALYASAVPPEWRGHVAGIRNAMLSFVFVVTSLVSGYLLNHLPMTVGYPLIFGLGFVGAVLSSVQLWHLRHITGETVPGPPQIRGIIGDMARPGEIRILGVSLRASVALRAFARGTNLLRIEVLRGHYGQVTAALFFFHLALFLPGSIFPLYWVNHLHFSDGVISVGTAIFHSAVLLGSLRVSQLAQRWGNHKLTAVGALVLSLYPLLTAFTENLPLFFITALVGGASWSLVGGAVGNYMLEKVPSTDRPAYLAWYNLALNAAVLLGSLGGSYLAEQMSLSLALIVCFAVRAVAAYVVWRVG